MAQFLIHTDGGSRGNPGEAAIGVVVMLESGTVVKEISQSLGIATNNEAEYQAVVVASEWLQSAEAKAYCKEHEITAIIWKLDSKLVVEQLSKRWKIKEPRMAVFAQKIWQLHEGIRAAANITMHFQHIPRAENAHADALVNQALDSLAH